MSYNCDDVTVLVNENARMKASDVADPVAASAAADSHDEAQLPESCFLVDLSAVRKPVLPLRDMTPTKLRELAAEMESESTSEIPIGNFHWCGEWSGKSFQYFLIAVAPKIMGHIEAVYTWEGGDSVSGLIIDDGKVTECDVAYKLTPKK